MPEALKNLYSPAFFERLSSQFMAIYPAFDKGRFLELVYDESWEQRELKARMRHLVHCLHHTLQLPYREALEVLKPVAALQPYAYEYVFFPDYIEVYGQQDWEYSLPALEHFTQYSSSEFAVRPFIVQDTARMMEQMQRWAAHPNEHVRRLASEGCRPRLPWAMALPAFKKDPSPILPILEMLRQDPSEYVRRSVSNNLNDIAKDHPDLVLDLSRRWYGQHPHTDWIVKRALRTLLKQGHTEALGLFGFEKPEIQVAYFQAEPKQVPIGEGISCRFALSLASPEPSQLRLEYGIYFVKSGDKANRKVFQLKEDTFHPGQARELSFRHSFRQLSTRRHYPGLHRIVLIVNGEEMAEQFVELI
ncbi:MAG: DNA alkylation repair protein [Bacteroidetes bacterium]|nr:MAG: DNA alkylation repair protein [Bacteroidota bacterium]